MCEVWSKCSVSERMRVYSVRAPADAREWGALGLWARFSAQAPWEARAGRTGMRVGKKLQSSVLIV